MSAENIQQQSEENSTSIELDILHINAKRAVKEAQRAEERMKREQFNRMSPEERSALQGQNRVEREARRSARRQAKAERFAQMPSEKQVVKDSRKVLCLYHW